MSRIWHRWSVPYLNFVRRFKYLLQYNAATVFDYVLVIRIPNYRGTGLLVLKTRRLDSAIQGNPPLHPISVSDCPRPECGVLVFQIFSLQKNLFIFNLLSAWLHPPHPPPRDNHQRMPYCYYFHYIFVVHDDTFYRSSLFQLIYKHRETKKSKVFPVKVHSCSMILHNLLPNMKCLWISWKGRHEININKEKEIKVFPV